MRIAIIGTGYVGLVTAACFATRGHQVLCVDLDAERVAAINSGRPPFFEAGLDELLEQTVPDRLVATLDLPHAVRSSEVTLIAVGTPFSGSAIDLGQVREAARQVGEALRDQDGYHLVIVKSTVLPGTTDSLVLPILEEASGKRAGVDFGLGMNPEFLREGQAVEDFMVPDRIVMGGIDDRSREIQEQLYSGFACPDVMRTGNTTAEATKYASNALLATLISFSNEIANLCSTLPGVDAEQVMQGVLLDKRWSPIVELPLNIGDRLRPGILSYLAAGCGFGGSCLPKDVRSLIAFGESQDSNMDLLRSTIAINERQPGRLIRRIEQRGIDFRDLKVALLGLAFKPGTSDIRETPALPVLRALLDRGSQVDAWDPAACEPFRDVLEEKERQSVTFHDELELAVDGADVLILMTSWPDLQGLPALLAGVSPPPLVVDGRRMLDPSSVERYDGIGLGPDGPPVTSS